MEAIAQLHSYYMMLTLGVGAIQPCIDWAIERLELDQEDGDLDIVLLAAATTREEAFPLVHAVLERYKSPEALDKQLAAGKYVASLRPLYLSGGESIESLDSKFTKLFSSLGYPNWLVILSRNCEYATDVDVFREPFEQEFEYIASLWSKVSTLAEFEAMYSREISNTHDVK